MRIKYFDSGYILVLTLLLISLSVALVTYIFNKGTVYIHYTRTVIEREKAKMLALSGVQLAMSQLAYAGVPEEAYTKEQVDQKVSVDEKLRLFLAAVLPYINQWQTIKLEKQKEGLDGTIKMFVACEDGKIDLNLIYDFNKHVFRGNWQKVIQNICATLEKGGRGKDLFVAFEKFLKNRQYKLNDVTELLTIEPFELFKDLVFVRPSDDEKEKNKILYLTDIFTLWSKGTMIEPWLLSNSLGILWGLDARVELKDKEALRTVLKDFKQKMNWATDWDKTLKLLYGRNFATLSPSIAALFKTEFEPSVFSVISYGTIGTVTQKVFAILERKKQGNAGNGGATMTIKKLYWL